MRQCVTYKYDNFGFHTFGIISPSCVLSLVLCPLCNTLQKILMVLGGTGQDDVSCTRMTTLSFLHLELSPFVIFDSCYALVSFPLSNSNTLGNILMVLGRNNEQDETTCPVQE